MRHVIPSAILVLLLGGSALGQDTPSMAPGSTAKVAPPSTATMTATMEAALRKAGFTDLQILPNSVLVRGKDKAGHAVAMALNPQTMTEVVTLDPHGGTGDGMPLTGSTTFATAVPNEIMASRLVGTPLLGHSGEALGTIRDVAVDHGAVRAYIVRVGGILGIGARYAAVTPAAVAFHLDDNTGRVTAAMDATPEQMKAAPEFKYEAIDEATR